MPRVIKGRMESWVIIQARMIRETELFLEEGLRCPGQHATIPAIPVGTGQFPRGWANEFWSRILASS
jgi:hypothetical protein